jgi:single-strand selective monofunctional uracil DNA glycosylase
MNHKEITDALIAEVRPLRFGPPVTHVYNPLEYARKPFDAYLNRFGEAPKEVVFLGMNPGPWGMAQTGVPFGEVEAVSGWMGITAPVDQPPNMHPKRPIEGFHCNRSEVSGRRFWGWIQKTFETPEIFFNRFFVANYCPLVFMEAGGRNRTPNTLPVAERNPLIAACDRALRRTVKHLGAGHVVGIGNFAAQRAKTALKGLDIAIGGIMHPSPANPKANSGWEEIIVAELREMGL